jgi:hypothetical protein
VSKSLTPAQLARNRLGAAARRRDPVAVENARRDLAAAKLQQAIKEIVDAAPPLSPEDAARLRALLPVPAPAVADATA